MKPQKIKISKIKYYFVLCFILFLTVNIYSQSVSLPTDRGRLKIVSIPDVKGGANLKVVRTDANTPLRGASPIIEKKQVQLSSIRENFIKDQSDARMNSIRLIWFEAWQKGYGYDAYTDFNNPTEVAHCLAMLETYVNLASKYGMYCIINFHSAFQRPYDEAYATQMWTIVGAYFKNRTHVAFETANEPSDDFNAWMANAEMQKHANIYNVVKNVAPNTMQFVLTPNRLSDSYPTTVNLADKLSSLTTIDWSNTVVGYHLYAGSLDGVRNLHKAYPAFPTENNFPNGSGANKDPWSGVSLDGDWYTSQTSEKLGTGWFHWAITNDCNCYEGWYANWPLMLNDAQSKGWYWTKDIIPASGIMSEAENNFTVVADMGSNGAVATANYGGTSCSNGNYLSLPDVGDEASIAISIPSSGDYELTIRVRSGWTGAPTYHIDNNAYEIKVNDVLKTSSLVAGSVSSVIDIDSYYGSLKVSPLTLNMGINNVRVKALNIWQKVDYIQVTKLPDTSAPSAPSGLSASQVSSSRINLSWSASTDNVGVQSYEIFNGTNSIGTTSNTNIALIGLTPNTAYSFTVKASDASNNISLASNICQVSTFAQDASIAYTHVAPIIDGTKETGWIGTSYALGNINAGTVYNSADLSASWNAMWDDTNLYIFVDVTDNVIKVDGPNWYDDDRIEIFIDAAFSRSTTYGAKQYQYHIRPGETTISEIKLNATTNVQVANVTATGGYRLELKIPFSTLGITPSSLYKMGLDVQVGDDDDGGAADGKLAWYALDDTSWSNPSLFGVAILGNKPIDTIVPSTPTALSTSAITSNSFVLSWEAATDNIAVVGYDIFKNGSFLLSTTATSATIAGLSAGITYQMTVRAKDAAGNVSVFSDVKSVQTTSGNILLNPGFESGITNWTSQYGCSLAKTKTRKSGTSAALISARTSQYSGAEQNITAAVANLGSGNYYIEAWVKMASGSSTVKATFKYRYNNTDYHLGVQGVVGTTWTKLSGTVNIAYSGTLQFAQLYFETLSGTTSFYVDDCIVNLVGQMRAPKVFNQTTDDATSKLLIYPNPATNYLSISGIESDSQLTIFNIEGKLMKKIMVESSELSIDVSSFEKGLYIMKIKSESKDIIRKIVVK